MQFQILTLSLIFASSALLSQVKGLTKSECVNFNLDTDGVFKDIDPIPQYYANCYASSAGGMIQSWVINKMNKHDIIRHKHEHTLPVINGTYSYTKPEFKTRIQQHRLSPIHMGMSYVAYSYSQANKNHWKNKSNGDHDTFIKALVSGQLDSKAVEILDKRYYGFKNSLAGFSKTINAVRNHKVCSMYEVEWSFHNKKALKNFYEDLFYVYLEFITELSYMRPDKTTKTGTRVVRDLIEDKVYDLFNKVYKKSNYKISRHHANISIDDLHEMLVTKPNGKLKEAVVNDLDPSVFITRVTREFCGQRPSLSSFGDLFKMDNYKAHELETIGLKHSQGNLILNLLNANHRVHIPYAKLPTYPYVYDKYLKDSSPEEIKKMIHTYFSKELKTSGVAFSQPMGMSYCAGHLLVPGQDMYPWRPQADGTYQFNLSQCKYNNSGYYHSSLIIGRRWNNQYNQCEYLIRNSWSTTRNYNRAPLLFNDKNNGANYWVKDTEVYKSTYKLQIMTSDVKKEKL